MTAWLPEVMSLDGDWDQYCDDLYRCFEQDLRQASFFGLNVGRRKMPIVKGKPDGFWHAISEQVDRTSEDRNPDLRRCERVPWIGPMISACGSDRVLCWEQQRPAKRGGNSVAVALPTFEFVVILRLRKRGGPDAYAMLVTAFCPGSRKRIKLQRESAAAGPFSL
ncbi:MAG TPA: hypothetical protein VFU16_09230 [Solirubrobacterales bacterium]|nr:hypothetical protein [Solirubrobacterales bacterium]